MKKVLALCFLLLQFIFSHAQETHHANYKVFRNEEEVGTITVQRVSGATGTTYSLNSSVTIKTLIAIHIKEIIVNQFEQGVLINSVHNREINDFKSINKELVKSGERYLLDGETLPHLGGKIANSVLTLYFQEPVKDNFIYSESFMEMVTIKELKPGVYRLTQPNKNVTDYYYVSGALTKVEAHTKWGVITFQCVIPLAAK